jgi:LysR family transcriptional regulator, glycine cleavage system transcriptional activator
MRKIAMLRALQAFEATARYGNYVDAASELSVTPAAVGQQVRALEAWLGVPLFKRVSSGQNRLVLTESASAALPEFREGFDRLNAGLRRIRIHAARKVITVTVSQAFVARWLLPRLDDFTRRNPDIDVRLDVTDRLTDIEHGEADIGIRCGPGTWAGLQSIKLMDEEIFPVCANVLLDGKRAPKTINDLGKFTLIHDTTMKETRAFPSWESWFQRFGLKGDVPDRGLQINSSAAVIQATLKGQGIALVRRAFVRDEIESGQLIRLLPKLTWPISWAYYVVGTKESLAQPAAAAFVEWIVAAARYDVQ